MSNSDSFVKKFGNKLEKYAGKEPEKPSGKALDTCSYMTNNGANASEFARKLAKGLGDHIPFNKDA